jgi:hypothetical protein
MSDTITKRCKIWAESLNAYLASSIDPPVTGYVAAEWLPKSLITIDRLLVNGHRGFLLVRMPSWLARERGFA